MKRNQLVAIATKLRKELELLIDVCEPKTSLQILDGSLPDLCGACMYGSIMLFKELKKLGRKPLLVEGNGHWFTHCDGFLIDITASQFGMKDVEVFPTNRVSDKDEFWKPVKVTRTIRGMDPVFIEYARDIKLARKLIRKAVHRRNASTLRRT